MHENPGPVARSVDRGEATVVIGAKHSFDAVIAGMAEGAGRVEAAPARTLDLAKMFAGRDEDYPLAQQGQPRAVRFHRLGRSGSRP